VLTGDDFFFSPRDFSPLDFSPPDAELPDELPESDELPEPESPDDPLLDSEPAFDDPFDADASLPALTVLELALLSVR
jgi:hypothetical protein